MKNTLKGKNSGIQWLDSTVSGMGRGPGNTRTEELIKHIGKNDKSKKSKIKSVKTLIKTHFHSLKKKSTTGVQINITNLQLKIKFILHTFKKF